MQPSGFTPQWSLNPSQASSGIHEPPGKSPRRGSYGNVAAPVQVAHAMHGFGGHSASVTFGGQDPRYQSSPVPYYGAHMQHMAPRQHQEEVLQYITPGAAAAASSGWNHGPPPNGGWYPGYQQATPQPASHGPPAAGYGQWHPGPMAQPPQGMGSYPNGAHPPHGYDATVQWQNWQFTGGVAPATVPAPPGPKTVPVHRMHDGDSEDGHAIATNVRTHEREAVAVSSGPSVAQIKAQAEELFTEKVRAAEERHQQELQLTAVRAREEGRLSAEDDLRKHLEAAETQMREKAQQFQNCVVSHAGEAYNRVLAEAGAAEGKAEFNQAELKQALEHQHAELLAASSSQVRAAEEVADSYRETAETRAKLSNLESEAMAHVLAQHNALEESRQENARLQAERLAAQAEIARKDEALREAAEELRLRTLEAAAARLEQAASIPITHSPGNQGSQGAASSSSDGPRLPPGIPPGLPLAGAPREPKLQQQPDPLVVNDPWANYAAQAGNGIVMTYPNGGSNTRPGNGPPPAGPAAGNGGGHNGGNVPNGANHYGHQNNGWNNGGQPPMGPPNGGHHGGGPPGPPGPPHGNPWGGPPNGGPNGPPFPGGGGPNGPPYPGGGGPNGPPYGNPWGNPPGGGGPYGPPYPGGGGGDGGPPDGGRPPPPPPGDDFPERPRVRESDKILLPKMPDAASWKAWKRAMYTAVVGASGRDDRVLHWLSRFEAFDIMPGELANSGEYFTLDIKLASALHQNAQGNLSIRINNEAEEAAKVPRLLTGREILFLYAVHFRMDQSYGNYNSILDLARIKCTGDADVEKWLLLWQRMRRNLTSNLSDADLCGMFVKQMKRATSLQPELSAWKQLPAGHPDKCIGWLEAQTDRWIRETNFERNRNLYETVVTGRSPLTSTPGVIDTPVAAATDRGRGRKHTSNRSRSTSSRSGSSRSYGSSRKGSGSKDPCREFQKTGHCRRGDRCRYSHDTGGRTRSPRSNSPGGRRKASPRYAAPGTAAASSTTQSDEGCRYWAAGNCPFGDKCKFSHSGPKGTYKKKPAGKPKPSSPAAKGEDHSDDDYEPLPSCPAAIEPDGDVRVATVFRARYQ